MKYFSQKPGALPGAIEFEAGDIIEAAKRGDENSRYRATVLGKRLSGDQREYLFSAVEDALRQANAKGGNA
jgi:hypothetical protein